MSNVESIFQPRSVAVIGASTDPSKIGQVIVRNLRDGGFTEPIYPINPKATEIAGLPAYPDLASVPGEVDQVTICIPAEFVWTAVKQCVAKKVRSIIIISAGFGESGQQQVQDEIAALCREHDIALVGPNVIGVLHPASHLNNSWMQKTATPGKIAFVSQSGALCCSVLDMAKHYNLGFSHFCSLGNKAGVDELDMIEYFFKCEEVAVIACYLEDIKRGHDLVKFVREHTNKPVIIFHSGKTEAAATAALSHTGSMTSERDVVVAAFNQAGIIEAHSFREFFVLLQAFGDQKNNFSKLQRRALIITNAGGAGIVATDALASTGIQLTSLDETAQTIIKMSLPAAASTSNPVDVLGDTRAFPASNQSCFSCG